MDSDKTIDSQDYSYLSRDLGLDVAMDFWNNDIQFSSDVMFDNLLNISAFFNNIPMMTNQFRGTLIDQERTAQCPSNLATTRSLVQMPMPASDGKISGIESLVQKAPPITGQAQILPGLFIRKNTKDSNFIGRPMFSTKINYLTYAI